MFYAASVKGTVGLFTKTNLCQWTLQGQCCIEIEPLSLEIPKGQQNAF